MLKFFRRYFSSSTTSVFTKMISGADRIAGQGPSVWIEFTALARDCSAVNLGQGFPDYPEATPKHVRENLANIVRNEPQLSQYTRGFGHTTLVNSLAKLYGKLLNRQIDPMNEILVTVGAYNALFYAVFGYLGPGDKSLIIEPYYDCYEPQTLMSGAEPVFVPLRPQKSVSSSADFQLDFDEFESVLARGGVKLLFLNNPNNPLGKIYSEKELMTIATLAKKYNLLVISDEVYEWLVYPPDKHIRFATLPGMYERTITIGSVGKTFSVTGWKIGWAIGPPNLIKPLMAIHQNCIYTCPTAAQEAVARSIEVELAKIGTSESYWTQLADSLLPKRERLAQLVKDAGMKPIIPEGGYFMMADYQNLRGFLEEDSILPSEQHEPPDYKFVKWLCRRHRLATIPCSCFYSKANRHLAENYIRFCFFKSDQTLEAANQILSKLMKKN